MQFGMIGLGRMGANMVRRLMRKGHNAWSTTVRPAVEAAREGRRDGRGVPRRVRQEADAAAVPLPDGARRVRGRVHRGARAAAGERRHDHRRRQLALPRRHRAGQAAAREGHPLRRHGHERRRLGPRARLLPDDRRREGRREASRADLQDARPRPRRHPADAGPREARRDRGDGLPPLRSRGRRPLREDGPQRDRVRAHGRLRRRAQHPEERRHRQGVAREGRGDDAAPQPRALPVRLQPRRHHGAVAARKRRHLLAPRPHRRRPSPTDPRLEKFGGKVSDSGEGRWTVRRRTTRASPRASSPPPSSSASRRAARTSSRTRSSPPCGSASAGTSRRSERRASRRSDALVFFGATGDLAYKKIFPALQAMARRGRLDCPVVGVAKSGWTSRAVPGAARRPA